MWTAPWQELSDVLQHWSLKALRRGGRSDQLERETAIHYLVRCSASNPSVVSWVRDELKGKYPFSLAHGDVWDCVAPFAIEHADVRAAVIATVKSEWGRYSLYHFQSLILTLGGDELRDALIEIASVERRWGEFWAVGPLLEGWGREDALVAAFLDEVAQGSQSAKRRRRSHRNRNRQRLAAHPR